MTGTVGLLMTVSHEHVPLWKDLDTWEETGVLRPGDTVLVIEEAKRVSGSPWAYVLTRHGPGWVCLRSQVADASPRMLVHWDEEDP